MENKMKRIYRQGDVLIERVDELPPNSKSKQKDNGSVILAYGEVTGHSHRIERSDIAELYDADRHGTFLRLSVVNSTAEPDGSFKDYWLRVDPRCRPFRRLPDGSSDFRSPQQRTALNAIASTFGLTGHEYKKALVAQS